MQPVRGVSAVLVLVVLGAVGFGVLATGGNAASDAKSWSFRYRVISVKHTSSSKKTDLPYYTGHSETTWKLGRAKRSAPNVVSGYTTPGYTVGIGMVHITGVYRAIADTNWNNGTHCDLTAPTGSKDYPATAPGPDIQLSIGNDARKKGAIIAAWYGTYASLSNAYFGSECSTSVSGEPDVDDTHLVNIPRSALERKRLVIRSHGATSKDQITYSWSTTFVLQKIVKKKKRR
jgi:hypothetical protein